MDFTFTQFFLGTTKCVVPYHPPTPIISNLYYTLDLITSVSHEESTTTQFLEHQEICDPRN